MLTVCDSGTTANRAADLLRKAGYQNVFNIRGGLTSWRSDNLPIVK
jgi:rhodanese-related sulfurtransferase